MYPRDGGYAAGSRRAPASPPVATSRDGTAGIRTGDPPAGCECRLRTPGSVIRSDARSDLAGLQAGRADALLDLVARLEHAHGLDVGVPAAARAPVGVGDALAEAGSLPAHVAVGSH